jgi:hypothetical protein
LNLGKIRAVRRVFFDELLEFVTKTAEGAGDSHIEISERSGKKD